MILVDVFVPSIDKSYNFLLGEDVPIGSVIEELAEMVESHEAAPFAGTREHLQLVDVSSQAFLSKTNTLKECSITTGSTLILV